jgi:hypothetical protein
MTDFAEEIKQIWQIDQPESSLTFTETCEIPRTIPRLVNGRLHIEVRGNSSHHKTILFHEGAHVYLFHLAYPASRTRIGETVPKLTGRPVDFLAEHYVLRLELEKRFNTQHERLNELRDRSNDAIVRVPIQGKHQLQPGSGQLAMQAAVCAHLLNEWGAVAEARQISAIMKASFRDLTAIYDHLLSRSSKVHPSHNAHASSLVPKCRTSRILTFAIKNIYGDSCALEFL